MAATEVVGQSALRKEFVDSMIKQVTARALTMKQAVSVESGSAWKETFFRESQTVLAGKTGNDEKGIPRGAAFPQARVKWERLSKRIEKYGLEDNIHWEDILTDDIDVQSRTLMRIAEGVAKSVDDEIYNTLSEADSVVNIQTFTNNAGWNESSATLIDDLMRAKQLIQEADYPAENLMLFVSPRGHRDIVKYLTDKGAQFPKISESTASNGRVGNLVGFDIVVTRSVAASRALVVIPKRCGTWKATVPLTTTIKEDPYKSVTVRAVEMGVCLLTDPKAVVLIKNTQMSG